MSLSTIQISLGPYFITSDDCAITFLSPSVSLICDLTLAFCKAVYLLLYLLAVFHKSFLQWAFILATYYLPFLVTTRVFQFIYLSLSVSLFISISLSKSPILISLSFCSNISFLLTLSISYPVSFFQSLSATFRRERKLSFLSKTIGGHFISRARAQAEPSTG